MSTASITNKPETMADLVDRLGGIPLERIRMTPIPGTATEEDVVRLKLCELIDGVIVQKAMGWGKSVLEGKLAAILDRYLVKNPLAVVATADGFTRLQTGRLRMPDVGIYLLSRFPGGKAKFTAVCDIAPDWAVEVVSQSNTRQEMEQKRDDFFSAGTRLFWLVDPRKRIVEVWTSSKEMHILTQEDTADLNEILPGFAFRIGDWFAEADAVME